MNKNEEISKQLEERVYREKEWHNQTQEVSNARTSTSKYYSISKGKESFINKFNRRILENMMPDITVFLDYGCGMGDSLIDMASHVKKGIGIDISEARIESAKELAKSRNVNNVDFFVMDAMHTTFNDNEFDVIRGGSVLHHLDLSISLNEIKRILKKDGIAYFTEPLATNPFIEFYRMLTPKKRSSDEQPFRRRELKIIKSIFPNVEIKYFGCFTLLAVPFRHSRAFDKTVTILQGIDRYFLDERSPFKYLAWSCALTMKVDTDN